MANLRMLVSKFNTRSTRFNTVLGSFQSSQIHCTISGDFDYWISGRWGLAKKNNITPTRRIFKQEQNQFQIVAGRAPLNSVVISYESLSKYSLDILLRMPPLLSNVQSTTTSFPRSIDRFNDLVTKMLITKSESHNTNYQFPQYRIEKYKTQNAQTKDMALYSKNNTYHIINLLIEHMQMRLTNNNSPSNTYNREIASANQQAILQIGSIAQIIKNTSVAVDSKVIRIAKSTLSGLLERKPKSFNALIAVQVANKHIHLPNQSVNNHGLENTNDVKLLREIAARSPLYYPAKETGMVRQLGDALKGLRDSIDVNRTTQTPVSVFANSSHQIEQLTRRVYDQLKREIRIEKERRGL